MSFFKIKPIMFLIGLVLVSTMALSASGNRFYRSFWHPDYHGKRLDYCTLDGKECGLRLASHYCRLMGYAYSDHVVIDHNVGLTNYLLCNARCKGWRCNGFKTIRCVAHIKHIPPKSYYYRYRHFVVPRYNHARVDWCYNGSAGCGRRAAFSFCRRMGFLNTRGFAIEREVPATKAIGNQQLCFGKLCNAFAYINCFR